MHLHRVPPEATWVWVAAPRRERPNQPGVHFLLTSELTTERIAAEIEIWRGFPSYVVYGYASAIETIAEEVERSGRPLVNPPACVLTTADLLTSYGRVRIERVFGCPVHSWYGSNELGGYLAGTAPGTERYLFNPLVAWIEVLDDEGRPAAPGEVGRLVATHLGNYGFPFVRYDTGDRAALAPSQGVGGFFVAERLEGRSSERIVLPSGRVLSAVSLGNRLVVDPGFERLLLGYQCVQTGDNQIEVRLLWRAAPSQEDRRRLAESLSVHLDPDTLVAYRDVDRLETARSGKRWVVRDGRGRASGS
jgi:phenylacetate-CoA ligase